MLLLARSHGQLERRHGAFEASLLHLTKPSRRLEPAEVGFDTGTALQAQCIAGMTPCSFGDGASLATGILGHMGCHRFSCFMYSPSPLLWCIRLLMLYAAVILKMTPGGSRWFEGAVRGHGAGRLPFSDARKNGEGVALAVLASFRPCARRPDEVAASCDRPSGRHPWSACVDPSTSWWDSIYAAGRSEPMGRALDLL